MPVQKLIRYLGSLVRKGGRARTAGEFEELFRHFREVVDSNTRALEIITEMGDVLGGEYLFDIEYVRRTHERLAAALEGSIGHFDRLTGGRFPDIREAYARIDGSLRRVIEGAGTPDGRHVLWLEGTAGDADASAGGKMANLAAVKQAMPLAVPDGFVITTHAFDAYLRHNHLMERTADPSGSGIPAAAREGDLSGRLLQGTLPPDLQGELDRAVRKIRARCGRDCKLAVRSSANEEDGEHSFAGQYETVLNVPADTDAVAQAYRRVIASLHSGRAAAYQERFGYDLSRVRMAVGCMVMVDASASGVLYTADPGGAAGRMVITAAWGLGTAVVDGRVDADHIVVGRDDGRVIEERVGSKTSSVVLGRGGGVREVPTEEERRRRLSISSEQIAQLVGAGAALEERFRRPQDVEWAFDAAGKLFILQSRPLRVAHAAPRMPVSAVDAAAGRIAFRNPGIVVQQGAAAGPVHLARSDRDLAAVPRGAVLVVRHDSPNLVRVMTNVSAIITDTGSLASHMASLAREFRVPTVVNTGDATRVLTQGREITVDLSAEASVYDGKVGGILERSADPAAMEDVYEFRRKRYLLRHITPLNLVDPFRDDFSPEACRTLHDILRFIHERSVGRLIEAAGFGARSRGAVKLDLPIPAGITVIDIGGGLQGGNGQERVVPEQVLSLPLRAVVRGMVHPGAWRSEAVPLTVNDFVTSMLRAPDLLAESERQTGTNVAVVSQEYMNLSIKFGYHYTLLDSYVSDTPRNNHIYFRFAGGATDLTKRSRRLRVIASILEEQGFSLSARGDMLIARISGIAREETETLLEGMGRLISYTRQLDAVLHDDADVERCAANFLKGRFELKDSCGVR